MKNSADQGGCYLQRPKAGVDKTLRDLQNSSYPTKAEFNNCFIINSKYFLLLKGVSPLRSLFFCSPNITKPYLSVKLNGGFMIEKPNILRPSLKMTILQPLLTTSRPLDTTSSGIILIF